MTILIALIIYLIKSADYIYLFQTEEYRFDRLRAKIHEDGWLNLLYTRWPRLPAKKPRNLLLAIGVLVCAFFGGYEFSTFGLNLNLLSGSIAIVFAPIIALIDVGILVWLTQYIANYQRTRTIMAAAILVKHSHAIFIGITGSYGKTTTKEFLYQLLSTKFRVGKTEANMNTTVGVAQSLLKNFQSDTEYFIVEMGAYKVGEIAEICRLTPPTRAILTAIGNQHLDLFGSHENLLRAKKELLQAVSATGVCYVNRSIAHYADLVAGLKAQVISFGYHGEEHADITATAITADSGLAAQINYQ